MEKEKKWDGSWLHIFVFFEYFSVMGFTKNTDVPVISVGFGSILPLFTNIFGHLVSYVEVDLIGKGLYYLYGDILNKEFGENLVKQPITF